LDGFFVEETTAHEVVINVIKPLIPRLESCLLEVNKFEAKSTPESGLAIATNSAAIEFAIHRVRIHHLMFPF
jgi:hypothetical protein